MLGGIVDGLASAVTPTNLLYCFLGVLLGTIIGMLPGLGSTSGVGLLLPLTLGLDPLTALITLAGIYYGCAYGGTISSVLIAAPGEAATAVTVIEGHQMARRGRAGKALAIAAVASFAAGLISTLVVMVIAPSLSSAALAFGPPEMVAVFVLALVTSAGVVSANRAKGLAMVSAGLLLSTIGIDPATGTTRFTFDRIELLGGIGFVEFVIGIFAIAEILKLQAGTASSQPTALRHDMRLTRRDLRTSTGPMLRGTGLGTTMGALPGAGSTLASMISFAVEKRIARGVGFGRGAIQGVAGPEAANNAATNASFVPMLSLGIPGSATTAVLLGALTLHGIQPGPLFIQDHPDIFWGLLASFLVGNALLLILNLPLAPVFASVLRLPYEAIYPVLLVICLIGAYAVENSMTGVWVACVAGVLGYFLQKHGFPPLPLILGLILGPMLEQSLSRSYAMGSGSFHLFLDRPLAIAVLAIAVVLLLLPLFARIGGLIGREPERESKEI